MQEAKPRSSEKLEATAARSEAPRFPIVGVGASAGGLAAFQRFFAGFPAGQLPGMAFVLVQHLAPEHKSILTELVSKLTHLEVLEAQEGMQVRVNCVYVIPPGRDLALLQGYLQLLEPSVHRGLRLPIDFFFRSLAEEQAEWSIGVILSGTGSDGALGILAIKGEGGLVLAQQPASTEFDGMPQSAIAAGGVDFVLPPEEMAEKLSAWAAQLGRHLPLHPEPPVSPGALNHVFVVLRAQTGHDFSQYKPNTVNRRIERRMAVHQVSRLEDYVRFLQKTPTEVEALFRDLLIGVTTFFRDPWAFEALEQALPALFAGKAPGSVIRVWSAGCSTGEEAYSLAILLTEYARRLDQHYTLQVFATDIDARAIAAGRAGFYRSNALVDLPPELLSRYFTPEDGGFRIKKAIRDLLIFSEQDVLKDPPFSRLDLLACRNLLIYLGPELQRRLAPLFFYALKPDGLLFLGNSEGIGDADGLFEGVDRKAKVYRRKPEGRPLRPSHAHLSVSVPLVEAPLEVRPPPPSMRPSPRELTEQALLRELAPPCALVDELGNVNYLRGRTGLFLEPSPGESPGSNLLKMAREGLRTGFSSTLRRAVNTLQPAHCEGLQVEANGRVTRVDVSVHPVSGDGRPLFLVLMREVAPASPLASVVPAATSADADDARIAALKQELRAKEEFLQRTNEELESSAEELKSSNEEMQSVNEELQSTNEELQTSKEELQSVNEELATVNTELQTKVLDLSRANSDMNNLLAGTGIGTVFVDRELKILRFTPAASAITNLIQGDVGRPVGHIVSNLVGYQTLVSDAQRVLDTLHSHEVDVRSTAGRWYTLRIQPYRTIENVIEGVVMSFTDISQAVATREALKKVNAVLRLAVVVRDANDAVTVHALDGHTLAWNPGATRLFGWTEAEALTMNVRQRVPAFARAQEQAVMDRLRRGEQVPPYETDRTNKSGELIKVTVVATTLIDETGEPYGIATTERAKAGAGRAAAVPAPGS